MALTDLATLKNFLNLPAICTSGQDAYLTQLATAADAIVKAYCKSDLETATYTEYPRRELLGTQRLALKHRPVYLTGLAVYLDPGGYFGLGPNSPFDPTTTILTLGQDYVPQMDGPTLLGNPTSRSGILIKIGGGVYGGPMAWPWGSNVRQGTLTARMPPVWPILDGGVKVVMTAGWGNNPAFSGGTLPVDLTTAANEVAAWLKREGKFGGGNTILTSEHLRDYDIGFAAQSIQNLPALASVRQVLAHYREASV